MGSTNICSQFQIAREFSQGLPSFFSFNLLAKFKKKFFFPEKIQCSFAFVDSINKC